MENPESRPAAAKLINSVIEEYYKDNQVPIFGWSLCMRIYDALVRTGYMIEWEPRNEE